MLYKFLFMFNFFFNLASRESKIPQGIVPRNLEDEGFYVGSPPTVPKSTFNKMENRLLAEYKEVCFFCYRCHFIGLK